MKEQKNGNSSLNYAMFIENDKDNVKNQENLQQKNDTRPQRNNYHNKAKKNYNGQNGDTTIKLSEPDNIIKENNAKNNNSQNGNNVINNNAPSVKKFNRNFNKPKQESKTVPVEKTTAKIAKPLKNNLPKSEDAGNSVSIDNKSGKGLFKREKSNKNPVKILFLGGVGEIGKNMTAIEYGDNIIIIDAGLTFPDEEMPGIDLVIPDITYLIHNKRKVKAVFLTHGHEDHIGGLPYLIKEMNVPVYATKLTLALADNKLREHRLNSANFKCVKPNDKIKIGCFEVECINVNHSIAGALAFSITTPQGVIFHSGDFKIDLTPVAGEQIDLPRISEIGKQGVTLLLGESTNVERAGYTMSEKVVGTTLDHLFSENVNRRIIVATFASNVHRLQQIIDLAVKNRRKVALSGRSMLNVVDAAVKIGELKIPEGVLIDIDKIKNFFDRELLIVSTGSQGEPMSALTRMASGEFNKVVIGENDTIIISASPIPGNEKMIYRVINNLYKKGAEVVYESLEKIHVSGHACQEELKILHNLLKPKFFIPVHGEYRHLKRHALLAQEMGLSENHILIAEIGTCALLTKNSLKYGENITSGARLVDGSGIEDGDKSIIMRDRKHLSEEGIFIVSVCVDGYTGSIVGEPTVIERGFMVAEEAGFIKDLESCVSQTLQNDSLINTSEDEIGKNITRVMKNFIFRKTKKNPMIVPIVVKV